MPISIAILLAISIDDDDAGRRKLDALARRCQPIDRVEP